MDLEKEPWDNTAGHLVPTCVCVCQLDTLLDGQQEHVFRSVMLGRFQIPGAGGNFRLVICLFRGGCSVFSWAAVAEEDSREHCMGPFCSWSPLVKPLGF